MDKLKIQEKNTIKIRISEINTAIKRNEATIARFSEKGNPSAFEANQIKKLSQANIDYKEEITDLTARMEGVEKGNRDLEFKLEADRMLTAEKQKATTASNKFKKKAEQQTENKKLISKSYRLNDTDEGTINRETEKYKNLTIPGFIDKNLVDMPGNKGYIWRNMWVFGEQEIESTTNVIMFEKLRDGIMQIHDSNKDMYTVFEKKGKDKKIILRRDPRRHICL